ncbi:MAG: hypothetical protein A3E78_17005 [Alphaproteobacteria bacterium RIFCSPHIGHO2_12_FULL_63_12]|nr:MAG: hypothetical protein A3E78_17005 [Alphaproteobacteria bacterium RIFCSPHIGHO2_12_FULL_63_12]
MYEEFYGLTEKPFSIQPDPSFLYWGRGHRLAYAMLEYGVVNQAGISVVTGEVGCGKTTLIHRLLDQLSDTHTIALLSNIQSGRGDLLSWVLMGFGEPYAGKTHVEMFAQLQSFFIREYAKGKRVVLIIDEAQNLSADMLEELRMLSNINAGKDQLLQLILVGQPQLKDLLSRPDMLQLAQRIGSDFHLTPLTREEVHAYIETRLSIAGATQTIFTPEAMDLIAEYSRGVPRVINTIADTALVYAFSAHDQLVSADTVGNVIRDKLDYGVFGLASSPELKLAEKDERRHSSGFIGDGAKARPAPVAVAAGQNFAAPVDAPRMVASVGMRYEAEPAPPVGGPSLYEAPSRAPASGADDALVASRRAPAAVAPSGRDVASPQPDEIGVVIICADDGPAAALSPPPRGVATVVVAIAGSPAAASAREARLELVEVDASGFSGGRARNAGYRRLKKISPQLKFVQFAEHDAKIDPDWYEAAARFMARRPEVAALEGLTSFEDKPGKDFYRREQLSRGDDGELQATGPTALFRAEAFEAAGGFRGDILADETADLCIRLRRRGVHAWKSDQPMATIRSGDASFASWRARAVKDGYAYAAGAALHGGAPERYCAAEQARAVMWGAVFPVAVTLSALAGGGAMLAMSNGVNPVIFGLSILAAGALIYALKIAAGAARRGLFSASSWTAAAAATLRHFYEYAGVSRYWFSARKSAEPRKALA